MYCTSNEFKNKMHVYIDEIEKKSHGILSFVEYIPSPFFKNTILRFDINKDNYTLADVDTYEAFMQTIVHNEFLVDFMGSVYQKVGFEPWMYEDKFQKCYHKYDSIPLCPRDDMQLLDSDAASILHQCGLPADAKVWEIQIEDDIALYILGNANQKIGTFVLSDYTVHVYEVDEKPCIGLMRAIMYAKMENTSMVRVLLEA